MDGQEHAVVDYAMTLVLLRQKETARSLPICGESAADRDYRESLRAADFGVFLTRHMDEFGGLAIELDAVADPSTMSVYEARDAIAQLAAEDPESAAYWRGVSADMNDADATFRERRPKHRCATDLPPIVEWPETPGVYVVAFAKMSLPHVKIGKGKNIAKRIRDLGIMAPFGVDLLAVLSANPDDEGSFHKRFKHLRVGGEWFRLDSELISAMVASRA